MRRFTFLVVWGFLFSTALIVFTLSFTVKRTILNPDYYRKELKINNVYTRLTTEGIPSLILDVQISDDRLTDTLAKEVTAILIQKTIDPAWIETLTDSFIDKTVQFLGNPSAQVPVDLTQFNGTLTKISKSMAVIEGFIPDCTENVQPQQKFIRTPAVPALPTCATAGGQLTEIKKDMEGIRQKIEGIHLGTVRMDQTVKNINTFITSLREFIANVTMLFFVSLGSILVLLMILFTVDAVKHLHGAAMKTVTISSTIASLVIIGVSLITDLFVPKTLGTTDIVLSPAMRSIANDLMKGIVEGIFRYAQIAGVVLLILSGIFWGISFLQSRKSPAPKRKK